jgi:hypothetical protein
VHQHEVEHSFLQKTQPSEDFVVICHGYSVMKKDPLPEGRVLLCRDALLGLIESLRFAGHILLWQSHPILLISR